MFTTRSIPSRVRTCVAVSLIAHTCVVPAMAQQIAPLGVHSTENVFHALKISDQMPSAKKGSGPSYEVAVPVRILLGVGGALAGSYVGAFSGMAMAKHSCDGPCIDLGPILVGSVVGAALLGATPRLNSTCGTAKRIALGLLGSALGGVAGGVAGASSHNFGTMFIASFAAAGTGSALGAVLCDLTE